MKSDEEVGSSGFWYLSSSTSRLRKGEGSRRPAFPRLLASALLPWLGLVTGGIGLVMAAPLLLFCSQDEVDPGGAVGARHQGRGRRHRRGVKGSGGPRGHVHLQPAPVPLLVERRQRVGQGLDSPRMFGRQGHVQDVALQRQQGT